MDELPVDDDFKNVVFQMDAELVASLKLNVKSTVFSENNIPAFTTWLILIFVALNPFPHTTSIREICYYLAVALSIFFCIRNKEWSFLKTPLVWPVGLFVLWSFVGLFTAVDIEGSMHDFRSHLLKYIALFCMLVLFFTTQKKLLMLGLVIILSVTVSSALGLYEFYFVEDHNWSTRFILSDPQSPVGPVGFMATYAALFSLHYLFLIKNKWKKLLLIFCLFIFIATAFLVQTRALLLSIPISFLILFWKNKKIMILFLIFSISIGLITLTKLRPWVGVSHYKDRLTINYISYLVIKEHPIKGIGFGIETFGNPKFIDHEYYRSKVPDNIKHKTVGISSPHNMWAGIAIRTGLVGLFLFLSIVAVFGKMCKQLIREGIDREIKSWGYWGGAVMALFCIYGLFNVVFMHFLETFLCIVFAVIAIKYQNYFNIHEEIK